MCMRGNLLVVSDWLINSSLKFYSRIAPPFAKGGAIVEKIQTDNTMAPQESFYNFEITLFIEGL